VVSGTLAYAIGAGKAILSTPYLYAKELLADGRGFLCEFRDSADMARQLTHILSDTALREQTERRAYLLGRTMAWPNVSRQLAAIYTAHPATASSEEKLEA
jgi:glycosyltransferase involved in cell wall biosynthesis